MIDAFLSYRNTPSRRAYVERLRVILDSYGISVWWDFGLEAGEEFEPQILAQLRAASLIVPLWCDESIQSQWVMKEAQFGLDNSKMLPARLQSVKPPKPFDRVQAHDLAGWNGSAESVQVLGLATKICERIRKPLKPEMDKLIGLRSFAALDPLPPRISQNLEFQTLWDAFAKKDDPKAVEGFLSMLRDAASDSSLLQRVEGHFEELKRRKAESIALERKHSEKHQPWLFNKYWTSALCPCGSSKKFRNCHGWIDPYLPLEEEEREQVQREYWQEIVGHQ
ncbi:MAG: TIR domain-containing protein [Pseudomonadota bacterium]